MSRSSKLPDEVYRLDWEGGLYFFDKQKAIETNAWYTKEFPPEDYGDVSVETIKIDRNWLKRQLHVREE